MQVFGSVIALREGSGYTSRYLVVFEDDFTLMVHDGKLSWNREESLASVKSIRFVDLPAVSSNSFISSLTTIFG